MLKRNLFLAACAVLLCAGVRAQGATDRKMRDAGLIDVLEADSTLRVRLMYSTDDNFMGCDVYGDLERAYLLPHFAAKLAHAHSFILRLPQGYDTVIGESGGSLSQGQRQLIAIARAAVADPPVMILDEATSSIDTHTEALVQAGMDALMKGRTVFVIAHRLSTVRNSDCIMVLDHGRIIERGTHDDLIAQRGTYYQLYTGVFELD